MIRACPLQWNSVTLVYEPWSFFFAQSVHCTGEVSMALKWHSLHWTTLNLQGAWHFDPSRTFLKGGLRRFCISLQLNKLSTLCKLQNSLRTAWQVWLHTCSSRHMRFHMVSGNSNMIGRFAWWKHPAGDLQWHHVHHVLWKGVWLWTEPAAQCFRRRVHCQLSGDNLTDGKRTNLLECWVNGSFLSHSRPLKRGYTRCH